MQTPRDVINDLFRGTGYNRLGLVDSPWEDTVAAWVKQGYPTRMAFKEEGELRWRRQDGRWVETEEAGEYEEPVPPWEHFGYDMAGVGLWFDAMPIPDYNELIEETDDWEIRRNGAGAALRYWKHKSGTPEHIDFLMTTREIWNRDYRPHLSRFNPKRYKIKEMRKKYPRMEEAQLWTHYGHMFIWELMRQSMGDVTLYESVLLDPGWIHDYNRVYTDFFKQSYTYLFEEVGLPDGVWLYEDLGYKNGLFASPKVLAELIFPYYGEIVDFFHSHDLKVVLHTCGSTAQALPLIVEAGFDGLNPMERKAKGNDPFAFAEMYADKLIFIGGLDARVLESNEKDIIRREVAEYIEGMKTRGARLVFATDHSISPLTSYDSYRYALDVYRGHMMY
ncbi:MAG: uroporphyrinogen decarboxylase family protein [Anaerolineales bacterium]|jgi:uroporphyrinogen decarboxylase